MVISVRHSTRTRATSMLPRYAATWSAVFPTLLTASILAPLDNNSLTVVICPNDAARMSAVDPRAFADSKSH